MSIKQGDNYIAAGGGTGAWGSITGTLSDQTDLQNALNAKANTDLSNLTSTGKNITNWSANVTNCITEIPQDIKLELSSGTLTLKAGSKVYIPNGASFDVATITEDKVYSVAIDSTPLFMFINNNRQLQRFGITQCFSGTSAPSGQTYMMWYDTTNKLMKYTGDGGSTWTSGWSFPICIIHGDGTQISNIDQVFNGLGYIGSTIFALPNVKGLIPNGRNADGTLKNKEFITSSVLTINGGYNNSNEVYSIIDTSFGVSKLYLEQEETPSSNSTLWYKISENKMFRVSNAGVLGEFAQTVCVRAFRDSQGKITSFTPKTAFHAVDYNDAVLTSSLATCHVVVETYINGTSWYRVYDDGWVEQGGIIEQLADIWTITFLKPFANGNYNLQGEQWGTDASGNLGINTQTETSASGNHINSGTMKATWYACGQGA